VIDPLRPVSVTVRPTAVGRTLVATAVLAFVCAWAGGDLPFSLIAMFVGALCLVAAVSAWRHASALRVAAPPPMTTFDGERFDLDVAVANLAARAAAFDVLASVGGDAGSAPRVGALLPRLPAGGQTRLAVAHPPMRRGLRPQGTLELSSTFPIGLFTCRLRFALPNEILVLPRLGTLRRVARPGAHVRSGPGFGGAARGDEQEVYGIRAWRDGEGLRAVHWKLSARRGRLLVREFRSDPTPPVHVVLVAAMDADTRKNRSAFEDAVSLAATLVERKTHDGHAVRLTILGRGRRTVACRRGRAAMFPALRALAQVAPEFGADAAADGPPVRGRRGETTYVVRVADAARARFEGDVTVFDVGGQGLASVFDRRRRPGAELLVGAHR
jgi:uncharacterized protein (DUF58 family)